MHIKHPKEWKWEQKNQRKLVAVRLYNGESRQCTMFVYFLYVLIYFSADRSCVCQAVVAQGARPSQPGPRSRAAAQKHVGGGAKCGGWGSRGWDASGAKVSYLSSTPARPAPSGGGCCLSWPPILFPSGRRARSTSQNVAEGKRMENQDVGFFWLGGGWNLPNMTKGGLVGLFVCLLLTVWVRAGVEGLLVVDVWKEKMGGCGGEFARPYE